MVLKWERRRKQDYLVNTYVSISNREEIPIAITFFFSVFGHIIVAAIYDCILLLLMLYSFCPQQIPELVPVSVHNWT